MSSPPRGLEADCGVVAVTARVAPSPLKEGHMAKCKSTTKTGRSTRPAVRGRTRKAGAKAAATPARVDSVEPAQTRGPTKQALIIGLLQRKNGAALADLVVATGWLPHTTRAALTRLRQSGHPLDKSKDEAGATVYRIGTPARTARSRQAA